MEEWIKEIKEVVGDTKYPKLKRIRMGQIIMGIVALPLGTSWLFPVAAALMLPISPTLWAKDKIRYLREWRTLK